MQKRERSQLRNESVWLDSIIVKPKNKNTFSPLLVGEVCNLAGAECLINSKLYYN